MFYMALRYEADADGEPDLELTDTQSLDPPTTNTKRAWELGGIAELGLRDTLLAWHESDPVDDLERRRNAIIFF